MINQFYRVANLVMVLVLTGFIFCGPQIVTNSEASLPKDQDEWTEENTLPLWNVKFNGTSPAADPNHVAGNYSISSTRTVSGSVAFQLQFSENLAMNPSNASLHFQVYAEDINEKLSFIRIHAPNWDNRFIYSPSLTLNDEGWTQVDLNISDFFSEDGSPDWNNIDLITLSFWGGSQGDIRIDKFYFENATPWQSPGIPANLTAAAGSGEVVLSWDTVENANSYNLYLSRHPGITGSNYRNNLLGMKLTDIESPYRLTGLNNGTTYYFIVTAENSLGEGLSSNEVSAVPITNSVSPLSFEDISMTAKIETTKKQAFGNPLWGDINNDGYLDIIDPHHGLAPSLYLNNGDETFKNIISESGISDEDYKFDQHGFALGDYNNDGNLDIFIAGKTIQLWEGDGTGRFFDVTSQAGIESSNGRTANWVDYDNDGNLDLFIRFGGTDGLLYKNDGDGHFIDVTDIAGLRITEPQYQIISSFADFDNDGDMDLFVGGSLDALYANNGDGTFSLNESFPGKRGASRGAAWGDYNNDGFIDLYVSRGTNDYYKAMFWDQERITFSFIKFSDPGELVFRCECSEITFDLSKFGPIGIPPSYIFIGEERRNPGEVPFTLSSNEVTGIPEFVPGEESGFFVWKEETDDIWHIQWTKTRKGLGPGFWGHIESDGDFIDVTTNLYPTLNTNFKNTLYRNNGDGTFTDVTWESRAGHIGNNSGVAWGDFDNDGYLDLYVVDAGDIFGNRTNTLYHNLGDGTFEDITSTAGVGAVDAVGRHYGAAWGDYNNDGTLDLLLSNGFGWGYPLSFGNSMLYKNLGNNNNWIKLKLAGTMSNRSGIGARVILNTSDGIQTRQLNGIGGELYSQGLAPLHFGLGDAEVIDSIMVIWPGGIVQTLNQIPANQELTIVETDQFAGAQIQFEEVTQASGIFYSGRSYGASWGDFNGDGCPDLWVSNHSMKPILYLNNADGTFTDSTQLVGYTSADMHGAAWADFDNDGDQDLIQIVGGGMGVGSGPNQLFVNSGGLLQDKAVDYGLDYPLGCGRTPLWFDWNKDGYLDVFLANMKRPDGEAPSALFTQQEGYFTNDNSLTGIATSGSNLFAQLTSLTAKNSPAIVVHGIWESSKYPNRIYQYDTLPFLNITSTIGFPSNGSVWDAAIADFNGDLLTDFYLTRVTNLSAAVQTDLTSIRVRIVANRDEKGILFRAEGDVNFQIDPGWVINSTDIYIGSEGFHPEGLVFILSSADEDVRGIFGHTSGVDSGVFIGYEPDTDLWHLYVSKDSLNISVDVNTPISELTTIGFVSSDGELSDRLFIQTAEGFQNATASAGTDVPSSCESVAAADFDNDMDVDLYLVCRGTVTNLPNILYENLGDGTFQAVPEAGRAEGSSIGRGDSVVTADYDGDGFIDLFVTNGRGAPPFGSGPHQLFRNIGNDNHWLEIDLEGVVSNRDGIGARLLATAGGITQLREQGSGIHRFAQDHQRIHFGLAGNTVVERLIIQWPNGIVQEIDNIPADQIIHVTELPGTANQPPTVSLSSNPTSGNAPLRVSFTATASDLDGSIAKYEWDFDGDGTYDADTGTTSTINYSYNISGTYNATVMVTDNAGATTTDSITISVSGGGGDGDGKTGSGDGETTGGDEGGDTSGGGGICFITTAIAGR